jgi:PiT family inorganic phosphate transporter
LAYWVFGFGVADTVANCQYHGYKPDCDFSNSSYYLNLFTWWQGIPSSSSHTLIGGFAGQPLPHAGFGVVSWYKAGKMVVCLREF